MSLTHGFLYYEFDGSGTEKLKLKNVVLVDCI